MEHKRACVIVLDGVGAGELPDARVIDPFVRETGRGVLGNKVASGT